MNFYQRPLSQFVFLELHAAFGLEALNNLIAPVLIPPLSNRISKKKEF